MTSDRGIDKRIANAESNLEALKRERDDVPNGWEVVTSKQWRRVVASGRADLTAMINEAPTMIVKVPLLKRTDMSLPEDARGIEDALAEWCRAVLDDLDGTGEHDEFGR